MKRRSFLPGSTVFRLRMMLSAPHRSHSLVTGQDALLFERACADAAIGLCLLDPSGIFLRVNRRFCELVGRTEKQLLGTGFLAITHPDDLHLSQKIRREIRDGSRESISTEKRYVRPDGSVVHGKVTISAVREQADAPVRFYIAQVEDTTARRRVEEELRYSREEFKLLAESSSDMIARQDSEGRLLYVSPASRSLLGYDPEELIGRRVGALVHPEDAADTEQVLNSLVEGGRAHTVTYRIRRKDGTWGWFETCARMVRLEEGDAPVQVHSSSRDVTARKRSEERIRELARRLEEANRHLKQANLSLKEIAATDPLTGLGNRRELERLLNLELRRSSRDGLPLSLLYLDLDHFKSYNDRYGHPAGDELLIKLSGLLAASVRTSDSVARVGGEEIIVLLPATDIDGAVVLGEKLRQAVAERLGARRPITLSVGAATLRVAIDQSPDLAVLADMLIQTADRALYRSKEGGRNRLTHELVSPDLDPPDRPPAES